MIKDNKRGMAMFLLKNGRLSKNALLPMIMVLFISGLFAQTRMELRKMTDHEFYRFKQKTGVYKEGENYNTKINGYGTGLRPPTEKDWTRIKDASILIDYQKYQDGVLPASHDNSATIWFPPIGNQDGEGSCVCWACGYYTKTFQEAREHNWDLSGCSWEGGYYGYPSAAYQDMIFTPDFIYHQVNDGDDNGSYYSDNMDLLADIGCCSWGKMPYDPQNSTSWPSEAAWRQAPLYRSQTGFAYFPVNSDAGIEALKELLASQNLAVISINANYYDQLTSNDLWTIDHYNPTSTNHANTIVGYDDNYGPYIEDGNANRFGAFKVANSWGTGSWENVDDGFLYVSYECMKQRIEYVYFYENQINYDPELVAILEISHNYRGECDIQFGVGSENSPYMTKKLNDDYNCNGGDHPFPSNPIILDVTEFIPSMTGPPDNFYASVYDGGYSATGTINSFSIERYDNYQSGVPSAIYSSSETPMSTTNNEEVTAIIVTGDNVISISPSSLHVTEEEGNSSFNVICNTTGSDDWTAAIIEGDSWLSITAGNSGSGNGTVTVHYTQNSSEESRTGKIGITADWAINSPQEAIITQDGTVDGLIVMVTNPSDAPAYNAIVEVYSDTSRSYSYENNYLGYTDQYGQAVLPDVPDGEYTILVYSYYDHFMFVLENVLVPGRLELAASGLTPVEVYTYAKDGSTPIGCTMKFVPFSGTSGSIGTDGYDTIYVSNWIYNGIAAVCFDEPYHLVKFGQTINGPTSLEFNPVTMPTGVINVDLDDFSTIRLYHWCGYSNWSYGIRIQDGDNIVYTPAVYSSSPQLIKQDAENHAWYYSIRSISSPVNYDSFQISSGFSYTLEAGGEFLCNTVPENSSYQSGQQVHIDNNISDSYNNGIYWVSGYIDEASLSLGKNLVLLKDSDIQLTEYQVSMENKNRFQYSENDNDQIIMNSSIVGNGDGSYQSIYPTITITDPSSALISEENSYSVFYDYDFTLPNPADEGTYSIQLSLETGPHQGMISGSNSFYIGYPSQLISLTIEDTECSPTETIEIPVIANDGISNVAMIQLQISYCSDLLSYTGMSSIYGLSSGDVNDTGNQVNIVWIYSGTPMTVPDGSTLIVLNFEVNAGATEGQTCILDFTGDNNIGDPDENAFTLDLQGGTFTVIEGYTISGTIAYCESAIPIANAQLALTGDTELSANTESNGDYQLDEVQGNVTLTASKSDEIGDINGFDLLRLKNILLGVHTPTTGETWAGDCNGDEGVNGFDLLRLKNYLLGIAVDPPIATWGFDPGNYSYRPIDADKADQDFAGVIFGDVTLSWGSSSSVLAKSTGDGRIDFGGYCFDAVGNIHVPITSDRDLMLGMLDWSIEFDSTLFTLESLNSRFLEQGDCHYANGQIKIVWVYLGEEEIIHADESICELILMPLSEHGIGKLSFVGENYLANGNEEPYDFTYVDIQLNLMLLSISENGALPTETTLYPNYPNPFNPRTMISYYLKENGDVTVHIFNLRGESQRSYHYPNQAAGFYQLEWNGKDSQGLAVPSGIYFYQLRHEGFSQMKRMVLMK